jgi:hypothetical protein
MTEEEKPPTEAELREAELLGRALEQRADPGSDLRPVEDALGTAWLVRASKDAGMAPLPARGALERRSGGRTWRTRARAAAAAAAVVATVAAFLASHGRGPSAVPAPPVRLLRAELAAARPGAQVAGLDAERAAYRRQVFEALGHAYGAAR